MTRLLRCRSCHLLFRTPTDPPSLTQVFYQEDYQQGYTTDCPSPEELQALIATEFVGSERDYSNKIAVMRSLGVREGARVLDYGASWGYGTWQLNRGGYQACGYEISRARARYAREKLRVPVYDALDQIEPGFDVFFSSHVLEHTTSPHSVIDLGFRLLRNGGLFLAFTPNGSREHTNLSANKDEYRHMWGLVHPIVLDDEFYANAFADRIKMVCSEPYELPLLELWDRKADGVHNLEGGELAVAVLKDSHEV